MKLNTSLTLCTAALLCVGVASSVRADDQNQPQSGTTREYGTQPSHQGGTYSTQPSHQSGTYSSESTRQSRTSESAMESNAAGAPTAFNKASKLIGMNVENEQGEKLGEIKDLVINPEKGSVSYAVLSSGGVLGVGEKLLAVPLTAFTPSADEKHLVLQASKSNISQAESIGNNWPSVQNPSFGAMPFWQQSGSTTNSTYHTTPLSR
jgi:sporulation protein YlmC with PRC-barrel domain